MVVRGEMRGHPGNEVGCPQKHWMLRVLVVHLQLNSL